MLTKILRSTVALGAMVSPLAAQAVVHSADDLPNALTFQQALDVADFTVQTLPVPEQLPDEMSLPIVLDGESYTMSVHRFSVRSADFQVLVQGEDGEYTPFDPGPEKTFKGTIDEIPGSKVSGSLIDGQIDAIIDLGKGLPEWGIQPASDFDPRMSREDYIVYSSTEILDRGFSCGTDTSLKDGDVLGHGHEPSALGGVPDIQVCEVACDADVEFYQDHNSSVSATEAKIEDIISRASDIYEVEVEIIYEITTIIVRTAEPDPYTSTGPSTLLNQFQNHWNSSQGGIQRDVAHLFTGKNLSGSVIGIAYLNVICNLGSAYGLSERFTSNLVSLTGLTAHEIGHNWSAPHCNGANDCSIMCSGLGGCTGNLTVFGVGSENSILNKKNSVGCLHDAIPPDPPTINSFSPASIGALATSPADIQIFGTSFTKATEVDFDGTVFLKGGGATGFTIESDTEIRLNPPQATALGDVPVTVTNTGGTSPVEMFSYVAEDPPYYSADQFVLVLVPGETWDFQYASLPTDSYFWILALDPTTGIHKGFTLLAFPFIILQLPVDPATGIGVVSLPVDTSLQGITFYTQMAFFGPSLKDIAPPVGTLFF